MVHQVRVKAIQPIRQCSELLARSAFSSERARVTHAHSTQTIQNEGGESRGRQDRTEGETAAPGRKKDGRSSNSIQKGVSGSQKRIPISREAMSQKQHPQHGGEGKTPHRAEAFGAMGRREAKTHGTLTHLTQGQATRPVAQQQ